MNENNRVLNRIGARELTAKEVSEVKGGIRTQTVCTRDEITGSLDGDTGEC